MSRVQRTCTVEGCDRKHYGRGMCAKHYQRWCAHGHTDDPIDQGYKAADLAGKLRIGASPRGPDDCWEWQRSRAQRGYGKIAHAGNRNIPAHRAAYELHYGPIPRGMYVCHSCDNPPCVNPAHLFLGLARDNHADMVAKQRHPRLGTHGRAKMTDDEARMVRATARGPEDYRRFAKQFGLRYHAVYNLVTGRSWRDL